MAKGLWIAGDRFESWEDKSKCLERIGLEKI
jgi:hypothetical protein